MRFLLRKRQRAERLRQSLRPVLENENHCSVGSEESLLGFRGTRSRVTVPGPCLKSLKSLKLCTPAENSNTDESAFTAMSSRMMLLAPSPSSTSLGVRVDNRPCGRQRWVSNGTILTLRGRGLVYSGVKRVGVGAVSSALSLEQEVWLSGMELNWVLRLNEDCASLQGFRALFSVRFMASVDQLGNDILIEILIMGEYQGC